MSPHAHKELLEFYRLFLREAGLPDDTPIKKSKRALRARIKRTPSQAAKLGWVRRRKRQAKLRREAEAKRLKAKHRRAYRKGVETRKKKEAKRKREEKRKAGELERQRIEKEKTAKRDEAVETGKVIPTTPEEKIRKLLYDLDPGARLIVFENPDGSIDGEWSSMVAEGEATSLLYTLENKRLGVVPSGIWFSVGLHFSLEAETRYQLVKKAYRPSEPADKDLMLGGGIVYTNWRKQHDRAMGFLAAHEIAEDIEGSDKTGIIYAISVRATWNHGHRPA